MVHTKGPAEGVNAQVGSGGIRSRPWHRFTVPTTPISLHALKQAVPGAMRTAEWSGWSGVSPMTSPGRPRADSSVPCSAFHARGHPRLSLADPELVPGPKIAVGSPGRRGYSSRGS